MNKKKKFKHGRYYKGKKYVVCFVHEIVGNRVSCQYFYGFDKGVGDIWVIILPKS